jgi:HSP20 family molecular chaperone IbpA
LQEAEKMSLIDYVANYWLTPWDLDFFGEFDEDLDELFEALEENDGKKSKGYSMSYRWETGMEEPEITIKGDVDEKTVNKFLERAQKTFGHRFTQLKDKARHLLGNKSEEKVPQQEINEQTFTLEMPGLSEKDVEVKIKKNQVKVRGQKDKIKYENSLRLAFEPKRYELIADNGLFAIKFYKD